MKFSHQSTQSLTALCQNWIQAAFTCQLFSLHFCPTYDLSRPYHDIYPFPAVSHHNPMIIFTRFFRGKHEIALVRKIDAAVKCFGCATASCCRRLYSFQEVVVVTELLETRIL